MSRNSQRSGYVHCACRDCFELTIGRINMELCDLCSRAGCDSAGKHECFSEHSYGNYDPYLDGPHDLMGSD